MATFNGAAYLPAQLESIATQTLLPHELVVADDGSSDQTWEVLQRFAEHAPFPVRIMRNAERLGWRLNFATVAKRCTGEYVAFCDQDDVWHPEKIAHVSAALATGAIPPAAFATSPIPTTTHAQGALPRKRYTALLHDTVDFRGIPRIEPVAQRQPTTLDIETVYFGHCDGHRLIVRRDMLSWLKLQSSLRDPLFAGPIAHDRLLTLAALTAGRVAFLDEPLTCFRLHEHSVTRQRAAQRLRFSGAREYAYQSLVLKNWTDVLTRQSLAPTVAGRPRQFARAALYFSLLRRAFALRARMYRRAFPRRVADFGEMLAGGAYLSRSRGGLGARSLSKDLLVAANIMHPAPRTDPPHPQQTASL